MNPMWMAFAVALSGAVLLTPLARMTARRLRIVDAPDGKRKLHKRPVPLFGGMAVYISLVLGLTLVRYLTVTTPQFEQLCNTVIAAAGFVCLLGCIDDTWDLNARLKLLLQTCSVLPIVLGGFSIDRVQTFGLPLEMGWVGVPITVLWLVACINALNLLDGMDGLASVVGMSSAAMLAIIASNLGHDHVALVAMTLAGALAGFLVFNLPPASIYLGDSGSMVIGLVVGILSMQAALKTNTTLAITAPAVLMSIPMLDTVLAIVRRKLSGQTFDTADRGHIHHRLLERGFNNWQALGVIGLLCLLTGGAAAAAIVVRSDGVAWAIAISIVALMIRMRLFGHHELALIKLTVRARLVGMLDGALQSAHLRHAKAESLNEPVSFESAWRMLVEQAEAWPVHGLNLAVGRADRCDARHEWNRHPSETDGCDWTLSLSFRQTDERFCRVQVLGKETPSGDVLLPASAVQSLTAFVRIWSACPDQVPVTLLTLVAGTSVPAPLHTQRPREAA